MDSVFICMDNIDMILMNLNKPEEDSYDLSICIDIETFKAKMNIYHMLIDWTLVAMFFYLFTNNSARGMLKDWARSNTFTSTKKY